MFNSSKYIIKYKNKFNKIRNFSKDIVEPWSRKRHTVTLVRGDGIGREVTDSVQQVFCAMNVPIDWEAIDYKYIEDDEGVGTFNSELIESINRNRILLKGPLFTPIQTGHHSPDVALARLFSLHAHVVPVQTSSIKTRHDDVDLVIIRENTEGEYSGLEHLVNNGVVQSLKVITRDASRAVAEYAFQYAEKYGRKKVTAVHKANIMKKADGLFLKCCREVAGLYKDKIEYDEMIIDNCCMQLVSNPAQFDVIVTGNLYGNIISDAASGLAGGVGLIPGFNAGQHIRVYEQGCRHLGNDIANKNKANPIALLRASAIMLNDMKLTSYSNNLNNAIQKTLETTEKTQLTADLGGQASTTELTQLIINNLDD